MKDYLLKNKTALIMGLLVILPGGFVLMALYGIWKGLRR